MSGDEQMAAIGKLTVQRRDARQQSILLAQEIRDTAAELNGAGGALTSVTMSKVAEGLMGIEKIIQHGGLDRLKQAITEYQSLEARIRELSQTLSATGAE